MKLGSPLPQRKARIEIIPLIDIMFFLLACFMVVSLSMVQMRGMKINMPTASSATPEQKSDFVTVTVDFEENIFLEKEKVTLDQLFDGLKKLVSAKPDTRIYIRGDKAATHGVIVGVLDKVKLAGITKVAFELRLSALTDGPTVPTAPVAPIAPIAPVPPSVPAGP